MTLYNIIHKFPGHEILYMDPFTSKIFVGTELEAAKIAFLLNDQQEGEFIVKEALK